MLQHCTRRDCCVADCCSRSPEPRASGPGPSARTPARTDPRSRQRAEDIYRRSRHAWRSGTRRQAIQAEGTERTSRAAKMSAVGAIFPSASLSPDGRSSLAAGRRASTRMANRSDRRRADEQHGSQPQHDAVRRRPEAVRLRTAKYDIAAAEANRVAVKYDVALR